MLQEPRPRQIRATGIQDQKAWSNGVAFLSADLYRKRFRVWLKVNSVVEMDCPEDFDNAGLNDLST